MGINHPQPVRATGPHTGHQKHGIDAENPVLLEHLTSLADEHTRLLPSRGAPLALDGLCSKENFTLWNNRPDGGSKYGYGRGGPEEGAPRVGCVRDDAKV